MPYELPGLRIPQLLGRRAELAGLVRDLVEKATPDHISVVAPRYFGKSVLIQALAERFAASESHYRLVINWDLRHNTPEDDRGFQIALAKLLDKRLLEIGNASYHDYLQETEGDLAGTISDVVDSLAAEGTRILILLDDFDRLASQPQVSKNLWDYLRSLAQKEHVRFVLSSRRRLRECIPNRDGRTSDFWNIFTNVVTLKPFSADDLDEFLGPISEAGFHVEASGKQAIVDWTGGVPILAARLCGDILACSPPARVDKPFVESRGEQITGDEWMQDALTLLWDDCGKDLQGDLLDIAGDPIVVGRLPPIRQQLLADRGYIVRYGGAFKAQCRFMQLFAAGHEVRSRDLRDLFKDAETELRSLKSLLQLRLSAVAGGNPDTRSYIEHAIEGLARGQRTALTSFRSIADEAISIAWEVECPGNVIPAPMQAHLTKSRDSGGAGMHPDILRKLNDKNVRRTILRAAAGSGGAKIAQKVSRPMMLLIDYLYNVGNYGQHMNDIPPAQEKPVDVSFCAGACWSAIELMKRMSEDLN